MGILIWLLPTQAKTPSSPSPVRITSSPPVSGTVVAMSVIRPAASKLITELRTGAQVDKHTADHLILPASLADGETVFRTSEITLHTLTAIKVAETFTDAEFKVSGRQGEPGTIRVKGIGHRRS